MEANLFLNSLKIDKKHCIGLEESYIFSMFSKTLIKVKIKDILYNLKYKIIFICITIDKNVIVSALARALASITKSVSMETLPITAHRNSLCK